MTNPRLIVDNWALIGACIGKEAEPPPTTCDEWMKLMPVIFEKMACYLQDPGLKIDLEGETIDHNMALKTLRETAMFIQEMCALECDMETAIPDSCDDWCW